MITGSLVALVTPMREDGAVDHEALARLVDRTIEAGTAAIVSVGTTGESATLDVVEHTDVIRRTIDVAAGRVPVVAGTGANSTAEAIHVRTPRLDPRDRPGRVVGHVPEGVDGRGAAAAELPRRPARAGDVRGAVVGADHVEAPGDQRRSRRASSPSSGPGP